MTCRICGGEMEERITDLPFKLGESSIVIVKGLPVVQCSRCSEYLLADAVMAKVDHLLQTVNTSAELEIIRYAA